MTHRRAVKTSQFQMHIQQDGIPLL